VEDVIDILAVFPDKVSYCRIERVVFVIAIGWLVASVRAENVNVILKIWGNLNFVLEDECHVILEYGRRICPSLRKDSEAKHAEGRLEGGNVLRFLCESSVVKAYKKIHHCVYTSPCWLLGEVLDIGEGCGIFHGDWIKLLEVVYYADCPVLLCDAKPTRLVRGVRWLINTRCDLWLDKLDDFIFDTG
jgi:hypothetical protein